jgi:flagellar motor switch protein FliN/FliY
LTNNKDFLSQDEIDALLRGGFNESNESEQNGISDMEMDALGEIGNISLGSAATALSTLLGQKVDITTPRVSTVDSDELKQQFPQPHVAINVDYVDGIHGINLLVIRTYDAQVIANLMMGGDGHPAEEELSEFHISAVQEAMNQMMGSAATSMSTMFNRFVNIGPPGVDIVDFSGTDPSKIPFQGEMLKVSFRLKIGNLVDSEMMQLIPMEFGKDLVKMLMESSMASAATAATAAAVAQPPSPPPAHVPPAPPLSQEAATPMQSPTHMAPPSQPQPQTNRNVQVQPVQFAAFDASSVSGQDVTNLSLLLDIPLKVTVELGRTTKQIREILELSQGSIIELDKLAGEPVDILVNNKLIAKGEVVVIEENFGVRVTDIISQWDRVQKLQ